MFQNEAGFFRWLWVKWYFTWFGFRREGFLGVWECSPTQWSVGLIVYLLTSVSAANRSFWSSPWLANAFWITSRQMNVAACSFNVWGCPVQGRSLVKPCCFHFWMMALIVPMGILILWRSFNIHSMIMMVNHQSTNFSRELLCLFDCENLCTCQPEIQRLFKEYAEHLNGQSLCSACFG